MEPCAICQRVEAWRQGRNPRVIHEFRHSLLMVGDHQFHSGYCLLILKEHVRELHEMPRADRLELFDELMEATEAIAKVFHPAKFNHASYGNQDPHVHWHIFPRYADDPDRHRLPWVASDRFHDFPTTDEDAERIAALVRPHLGDAGFGDAEMGFDFGPKR